MTETDDDDIPTFGSSEVVERKPLRLRLIGVEYETQEPTEIVLRAFPTAPTGALLDVMEAGKDADTTAAMLGVLRASLIPEDEEALDEWLRRPGLEFDLNALGDLVKYLVEHYTARPTKQPASSRAGRRSAARGSTGRASGKASASATSRQQTG